MDLPNPPSSNNPLSSDNPDSSPPIIEKPKPYFKRLFSGRISVLLTLLVYSICAYGAGVATPYPGDAPPMAGFNVDLCLHKINIYR